MIKISFPNHHVIHIYNLSGKGNVVSIKNLEKNVFNLETTWIIHQSKKKKGQFFVKCILELLIRSRFEEEEEKEEKGQAITNETTVISANFKRLKKKLLVVATMDCLPSIISIQ